MAATYDRAYGRADYPPSIDRWARHSAYSDPGRHAALLDQAEPDITTASMVAQNLIAHYRFASTPLPESSNDDINARWLSTILEIDQQRHGAPLTAPRPEAERVQGCCRDHTLIAVGILRQHGVPARSRVGFADYLRPESRVDHVVAEAWLGGRWVRFDPGLAGPRGRVSDPHDIVVGNDSPFLTAATAWSGYRRRGRPIDDLGVRVGPVEFTGPPFVLSYLIMDVRDAIATGNAAYERRFGRVFLIRAAGRSPEQILAALTARLGNDDATEDAVVAGELREIALLRLEQAVAA